MIARTWDIAVCKLHWMIAATVTFQQFTSLWMSDPGTQYLFPFHRVVGAVAAVVLVLFWIYSHVYGHFTMLFPWRRTARREVLREARVLLRGQLPASGPGIGLSGFIHGLGVIALTGCALTGAIMFAMIPPGHTGPPDDPMAFTRYTLQHKFFGEVLWWYWCGHVALALFHQFRGDNVLGAMFRVRQH